MFIINTEIERSVNAERKLVVVEKIMILYSKQLFRMVVKFGYAKIKIEVKSS